MATKRKPGSRPGLIKCEYCGEEYSSSYRRCPFCDEYDEYEYEDEASPQERGGSSSRSSGGKRLAATNKRGGGYGRRSPLRVIFTVLKVLISLAVIAAAIWVVVTQIKPLIERGDNVDTIDPDTSPSSSLSGAQASPSGSASGSSPGSASDSAPGVSGAGDDAPSPSPSASGSGIPASDTANGFTLNKADFAFSNQYPDPVTLKVTFTPSGTTGTITWSSSNEDVATVNQNGTVSAGAKSGTATITATMANGVKQTCIVYNQITGTATTQPSPSPSQDTGSSSAAYTVNNPDFTFYTQGESYTLKVRDYTGGVSWSSSDTSVVTVDSSGKCVAVGNGRCTITGTLDNGSTVKATVYVRIPG